MLPFVPESPRYLFVSKRFDEADAVLKRIVSWNRKSPLVGKLSRDDDFNVETPALRLVSDDATSPDVALPPVTAPKSQKANFFLMFNRKFLRVSLTLLTIWFLMAFCYYGVVVLTPEYFKSHSDAKDEPYLAVFITSAAELPGIILAAVAINRFGRKKTQISMFAVCGLFMMLLMIPAQVWLLTIFAVVCRMCIMGAFGTTYVFTPEVFPTIIRSTGLGTCASSSRIGALITPFVATAVKASSWIPLLIYGIGCILAAIVTVFVPVETANKHLVDDVEPSNDYNVVNTPSASQHQQTDSYREQQDEQQNE